MHTKDLQAERAVLSVLGYCYYKSKLFAKAASAYNKLRSKVPGVKNYAFYEAQSWFRHGEYEQAIALIDSELARSPLQEKALAMKAACLYELGRLDEAAGLL